MATALEEHRLELINLLEGFDPAWSDLRQKVLKLVPALELLRNMGTATIPRELAQSARDRILYYFQKYPLTVISNRELMVISGISEWARRVRELRRQYGWDIVNGLAVREMIESGEVSDTDSFLVCAEMTGEDYVMLSTTQDREAAHRWHTANEIRKGKGGAKAKILSFLLENVGIPVSGEELRYVTKDRTEWARRARELRTEEGWQICTHWNGRPDLSPGMYVLETERQLPKDDRNIDEHVRRTVLTRDNHSCRKCGWSHDKWNTSDPRHLELHHIVHHVDGGANTANNLTTLCNVCHDLEHRKRNR